MEITRRKEDPAKQPISIATVLVRAEATAGRLALIETIERPGAEPPCHRHHWEDKLLYVLEGEIAFFLAGQWHPVSTGQAALAPRGAEHTFAVLGDQARLLVIFSPAGFEGFYQDIAQGNRPAYGNSTGSGAKITPDRVPSFERWVTAAARYGCEVTGPHPGRPY